MAANDEVIKLLLDLGVSKENVQQVVTKLDELKTTTTSAAAGLDKVEKSTVNTGHAMLQTGRIVQDFVQGGFGGILNNIEGFTNALGLGSGLAGLFTAVGVAAYLAMPKIKEFFGGISGEAAEKAKEKLKELRAEIEKTHQAFLKLTEAPTDIEKTSAETITAFLGQRPHAEMAREAITRGMGRKTVEAALTAAGTREEWGLLGPAAEMSDQEIERQARVASVQAALAAPGVAGAGEGAAAEVRRRLTREREAAQQRRFLLEKTAKGQFAEAIVVGAQQAGPAGAAKRRELLGRTKGVPGLEALQEMSPEQIAQQEADFEVDQEASEAFAERARAGAAGKRAQRQREATKRQDRMDAAERRQQALKEREEQQRKQFFAHTPKAANFSMERARRQAEALRLQQVLANPMSFTNDRQEAAAVARLGQLQKQLGRDFPQLMAQTVQSQEVLVKTVEDLARRGSRVANEIRATWQRNQTAMNMGAPF